MKKFYVKKGVGSISLNQEIFNEGDEIKVNSKEAKILAHLITTSAPEEPEVTEPTEEVTDEVTETTEDTSEEDETNEDTSEEETDENEEEDEEEETEIDLAALDLEGLKALATENGVSFAQNIGEDTLRNKLVAFFEEASEK